MISKTSLKEYKNALFILIDKIYKKIILKDEQFVN